MMRFHGPFAWLSMALLLNACAATATQDNVCHGQQIIIHLAPGTDVARPGFNAGLARAAGVSLDYMRPLFDDYYLYCAGLEGQAALPEEGLAGLQQHPDIRTVEIDRLYRPQRNE